MNALLDINETKKMYVEIVKVYNLIVFNMTNIVIEHDVNNVGKKDKTCETYIGGKSVIENLIIPIITYFNKCKDFFTLCNYTKVPDNISFNNNINMFLESNDYKKILACYNDYSYNHSEFILKHIGLTIKYNTINYKILQFKIENVTNNSISFILLIILYKFCTELIEKINV